MKVLKWPILAFDLMINENVRTDLSRCVYASEKQLSNVNKLKSSINHN